MLQLFWIAVLGFVSALQAGENRILWDSWYTVKVEKIPYQIYQETVEVKDARIRSRQALTRVEEGHRNEEQLGTLSENNEALTPVLYNFRSTYRKTERQWDGTVTNGVVSAKVKSEDGIKPALKRSMPKGAFFSSLFPLWLVKQEAKGGTLTQGKLTSFTALLEDTTDSNKLVEMGRAQKLALDELARSSGAKKYRVTFRGSEALWWILPSGKPLKIEITKSKTVIQSVSSEAEARTFLGATAP